MPSIHESIRDVLLQHERNFWTALISADVPAMEKLCKPDANFLFPRQPIVALDEGEPSLQDVVQPPFHQFDYYSLGDARMIVLGLTTGVITYQITAAQGDEMYNATGSSTWSQDVDGQWRLACHQETLLYNMSSFKITSIPCIQFGLLDPNVFFIFSIIMIATRLAPIWGQQWRSSPVFIVAAVGMALFTDSFVYTFAVPIFPYIVESRLALDSSYTQRMSFTFISQSALVSVMFSPLTGYLADKYSTKRIWLRSASLVALVGTVMVVSAVSPAILFIGRFVQALASTVAWVVGYAAIADNVKLEHLGKTYGLISTVVAVATSAGPMISGTLFDLGGYWLAWSSAFVVIVLNIVPWLLMLERSKESEDKEPSTVNGLGDIETAPFLEDKDEFTGTKERAGLRFYSTLFRHPRFVCGVCAYMTLAVLLSSFDTTLPLHVRDVFGWGSMQSGLLYVALQGPAIPLSVPLGWLKDRLGTRRPTFIGLLLLAPLLWLLGVPGDDRFPYANEGDRGRILYSVTMALIGLTVLLLNGAGTIEATTAIDEIQSKHPGIFGPKGGYSRAMSMASTAWTLGTFIGPILTGTLVEQVGYYEMECVLAVICLVSSVYTYFDLGARWNPAYGTDEFELCRRDP